MPLDRAVCILKPSALLPLTAASLECSIILWILDKTNLIFVVKEMHSRNKTSKGQEDRVFEIQS